MGESWFLHFYLTFTYNVTTNRFFFLPLSFFNLRQLEHLFRFPPPFTFLFIFTTPAATSHLRLMCRSALYSSWVTHLWSALSVPHFSLSAPYKERWLVPETMWPCKDQWEIFLKSNHHLVDDCCCAVCLCVSEISQPMWRCLSPQRWNASTCAHHPLPPQAYLCGYVVCDTYRHLSFMTCSVFVFTLFKFQKHRKKSSPTLSGICVWMNQQKYEPFDLPGRCDGVVQLMLEEVLIFYGLVWRLIQSELFSFFV